VQRIRVFEFDFASCRQRGLHFLDFFDQKFVPNRDSRVRRRRSWGRGRRRSLGPKSFGQSYHGQ
jgi:hypothetical protein